MYDYYYNPEVRYLLISRSQEKAEMLYDDNSKKWSLPVIGPRPPCYFNPRYEPYDPVI
ncbi:hypothetical protein SAMN04488072_104106 [Lentibacillus halodurans]|uniref:Uncharacterized protein n=1 Tax=Lentibacillus halodurans TaxID=237679 RepID=A0A1I0X3E2_9BACI|nr:hypothetical protein [Lentibacillus halodurans]SFA95167.1 hypothetical protein SAMN04488072_104106 [Lentibacillus halodurans]